MKEATETAKLRLFLKLVSTANPNYGKANIGIEPLPDIDFNIKCGNSLDGYATHQEVNRALQGNILSMLMTVQVLESMRQLSVATHRYKEKQLGEGDDYAEIKEAKAELKKRQQAVNEILDRTLYEERREGMDYAAWLEKTQPFHWISEFYDIVSNEDGNGGFDVVIGNPPYVEYSEPKFDYKIRGYATTACGNLYAYAMERAKQLCNGKSYISMIVPLSGHSTERMQPLITNFYNKFTSRYIINLSADANPSVLFKGVKFRLSIFIVSQSPGQHYTTKYKRWFALERPFLFDTIIYNQCNGFSVSKCIPKLASPLMADIYSKISVNKFFYYQTNCGVDCLYHNAPVQWIRVHTFAPYFKSERDGEGVSTQLKRLTFEDVNQMKIGSLILVSSLFYIHWITLSDCYHLNKPEIAEFKFTYTNSDIDKKLFEKADILANDMIKNSKRRVYNYKTTGRVEYDEFYMKKSKPIIDEIDILLGKHYGFTDEELDFILNYDIKYRMGIEDNDGEV